MTWYSQAGTPELVCQLKYDARAQDGRAHRRPGAAADAGRGQEEAAAHAAAARAARRQRAGHRPRRWPPASACEDGVIEVTKRTETFRFRDVPSRPVPSLLRGFSAPVNLTIDLSDADLQFLMANDSDLYNRWQAAQDYATRVLVEAVKTLRAGSKPEKPKAFVAALRRQPRRREPRARLPRAVPVPAERERPRPHHRPGRRPAGHPQGAQGAAQGDRHQLCMNACRRLPQARGQGPLLAGAGAGRQAGAAQRRARLPGEPRQGRGRGPRRGAFRQRPQRHRRGEPRCRCSPSCARPSGPRPSSASTSAGRTTTW